MHTVPNVDLRIVVARRRLCPKRVQGRRRPFITVIVLQFTKQDRVYAVDYFNGSALTPDALNASSIFAHARLQTIHQAVFVLVNG